MEDPLLLSVLASMNLLALTGAFLLIVLFYGLLSGLQAAIERLSSSRYQKFSRKRYGDFVAKSILEKKSYSLLSVKSLMIVVILLGSILSVKIAFALEGFLHPFVRVLIALFTSAIVFLFFGELFVRSIAAGFPDVFLRVMGIFFYPLIRCAEYPLKLLTWITGKFLAPFSLDVNMPASRVHSSEEMIELVSNSVDKGELDSEERDLFEGIFAFSRQVAKEVMTPRTDLAVIPKASSFDEVLKVIAESGYSRFPVVGENQDEVIGIMLAKDLLVCMSEHRSDPEKHCLLHNLIRPAYFIPSSKPVDDLLQEFKERKVHMAIVMNEHGGVDGVVTLEDLIEEIVGEIFDESDDEELDIIVSSSGELLIDGGTPLAEIEEALNIRIPEGEYDTISGFVFSGLGRIPEEGDQLLLTTNGVTADTHEDLIHKLKAIHANKEEEGIPNNVAVFAIKKMSGHRIDQIMAQQVPLFSERID